MISPVLPFLWLRFSYEWSQHYHLSNLEDCCLLLKFSGCDNEGLLLGLPALWDPVSHNLTNPRDPYALYPGCIVLFHCFLPQGPT